MSESTPKILQKMSRREMLRLTALTGAGLVAAAYVAPAATALEVTESPKAAPPQAEKVSLRLMVMDYDEKMKPDTQAVVDAFNASQSEIDLKLDVVSWGQGHNVLVTQISGGQPPDLCNTSAQWLGEWDGIGEVLPLDDLLSKEFLANFQPSGIKAFTNKKGQLMGLPYFLDPRAMYYRKDLFDAKGLKAPDTWDDVIAAGQALHNPPDMTGYGQTFSRKSDDQDYWWYAWFGLLGGDANLSIWKEDGRSRLAEPEAIQAAQYVVDLTQKYKITNTDFATAGRDEELQPLFYAGKLAMLITGSWYPTLLKNNAPDLIYGLGMPPVAKAGTKPATGFWPDDMLVFKQTKYPKECARVLEFMFNKENRMAFAKQRGVIPERIDVGQDPAYAVSDVEKFFVESLATAHNVYETPFPATYYQTGTEVETQLGRAVAGEISAEEAMKAGAAFTDETNGFTS
jgi:ABC-type glycerol-3-phosphate transport system substrate-binding protein